jgi:1-acyl-sn-glycerol-3-phosphate acyltransferase
MAKETLTQVEDDIRECRKHETWRWHIRIARSMILFGWLMSFLCWRIWMKVEGKLKIDGRGALILSTHRSMWDSFVVGSIQSLRAAFEYFHLMWFIPERSNFMFDRLQTFMISHMKVIPIKRSDRRDLVRVYGQIKRIIGAGGVVCLFPNGGRERYGKPLNVDPAIAHLILELDPSVPIIVTRIDGIPVWKGPKMSGGWLSKNWQFFRAWLDQLFLRRLVVTVHELDLSDLRQKPLAEVKVEIARRIAEAIKPHYPVNPAFSTSEKAALAT